MTKGQGRARKYGVTIAVVIIGGIASLSAFLVSDHSVHQTSAKLLAGDAAQGALVLNGYLGSLSDPFSKLGSTVTPTGVSPTTFDAAAQGILTSSHAPVALLHQAGGHWSLVASVGHLHATFGPGENDAHLLALAARSNANYAGVFVASGQRWIQEVYGKGYLPAGYAIYSEYPIGGAHDIIKIPGVLFPGTDVAVYVGSATPSNLLIRTSARLPAGRQVAVSPVNNSDELNATAALVSNPASATYPGEFVVVMSPTTNLTGNFAADFPWILLVSGSAATVIVGILLGMAIGRRDEALGYVGDLKKNNAELDLALSRQAEAEKSLRQAQRMEAVGQLAGGIAHDFNNLLQAIISYSVFLSESMEPESEMRKDLAEIEKAAHRAADLTRQLLVFSRQDVTSPTVLNLNEVVRTSERLLHHTLGEDVNLDCQTSEDPCHVHADAGELELMLLNLCINARDAMPKGGDLSVMVDTVDLGSSEDPEAGPGAARFFARLRVTDTGVGMTPEVAAKAFEPFFTTKETGRGTGLGLAMVYGIVNRWGGSASITTAVGGGTTVTLLFPLTDARPAVDQPETEAEVAECSSEVVLLVEDQEGVRRSTARILEAVGYRVMQADSATKASLQYDSALIDILVTDVIMPGGMSGIELAERLRQGRPDLPVVFISGYSKDTIDGKGHLPPYAQLVQKPFLPAELLNALRLETDELQEAAQSS